MSVKRIEGKPFINIARAELVTEETNPTTYIWETASKCSNTATISEGQETLLRYKNTLRSTYRTEDIQYGNELGFTDNVIQPELLALVDGGTLTIDAVSKKVTKYTPPAVGEPVKRTPFTLNIYTEEKDADGETLAYAKFSFPHCKGKPISYSIEDGVYMAPELTFISRPKVGTPPYEIDFMNELPTVTESA